MDKSALLRLVKLLVSQLDKLALAIQKQSDAIREQTEAAQEAAKQETKEVHLTSPISVELNEAVTVAIQGEAKAQITNTWDWRDYVRFGLELIGLGVLVWYACTTQKLWNEAATSNRISKANEIASQRAYVHFSPAANWVYEHRTGNQRAIVWDIQIPMENYGLTPTRRMRNHISRKVNDTVLPDSFDYPDTQGDDPEAAVLLAPHQELFTSTIKFDSADLQPRAMKHAYIYGWASYRDVFDDTPEHITKFCYEMTFS